MLKTSGQDQASKIFICDIYPLIHTRLQKHVVR